MIVHFTTRTELQSHHGESNPDFRCTGAASFHWTMAAGGRGGIRCLLCARSAGRPGDSRESAQPKQEALSGNALPCHSDRASPTSLPTKAWPGASVNPGPRPFVSSAASLSVSVFPMRSPLCYTTAVDRMGIEPTTPSLQGSAVPVPSPSLMRMRAWSRRESNPRLCDANAACSRYHYDPNRPTPARDPGSPVCGLMELAACS
jgi:hypothetical protein